MAKSSLGIGSKEISVESQCFASELMLCHTHTHKKRLIELIDTNNGFIVTFNGIGSCFHGICIEQCERSIEKLFV